ncbi:MAG: cyanophycin synthetase, partial [Bacteroidetes bacterium]|nr:cyanophycin synthetase [Bacteroidota bacterium]
MEFDIQSCVQYEVAEGPLKAEMIKILGGANFFSGGPVVLIRLNLSEYDEVFTSKIPGFYEKLKELIPSLYDHHCSIGAPGGFLQRVQEGTLLGHVAEHVAIELQTLAGMDVAFGKTRSTLTPGVYHLVFRFFDEIAGIYAGKAAISLINSILTSKDFNITETIANLIQIREHRMLGPSTQAIVDEA